MIKYFRRLPEIVTNCFTRLREKYLTYFYVIFKYYHTEEDGGVLGYPIQDSQHKITLRKYLMGFPV